MLNIKKHSWVIALASATLSRSSTIIFSILCARILDADLYGVFSYYIIAISSIATISSFGIGIACSTTTAKNFPENTDIISATLTATALICFAISVILAVFATLSTVTISGSLSLKATYSIMFFMAFLISSISAIEGILYALSRVLECLKVSLVAILLSITVGLYAIPAFGLSAALCVLILHRLIILIGMSSFIIRRTDIRIKFGSMRKNLKKITTTIKSTNIPIAATGMLAAPTTAIAVFYIGKDLGSVEVAKFSLGYQIFLLVIFPPGALVSFFVARMSSSIENSEALLRKNSSFLLLYGVVSGGGIAILGTELGALITPNFALDELMMYGFGISTAIFSVSTAFNSYWPAIGKSIFVFLPQCCWSISVVISLYLLLPVIGVSAGGVAFGCGALSHLLSNMGIYVWRNK